jgi:UDP-N-acetylmuramate-alanine ligase
MKVGIAIAGTHGKTTTTYLLESILKKGLDQQPSLLSSSQRRLPLLIHENLRGKEYYQ